MLFISRYMYLMLEGRCISPATSLPHRQRSLLERKQLYGGTKTKHHGIQVDVKERSWIASVC